MASLLTLAILLFGSWQEQAAGARPLPLSSGEISALRTKAEAGDPSAQFALGQAYDYGDGVEQSDKTACSWYRRAADQGFAPAQNSLGVMYRSGRGVEQSKEQAVLWYRNAAKQKNAKAMFNLGTAYYNGDGAAIIEITHIQLLDDQLRIGMLQHDIVQFLIVEDGTELEIVVVITEFHPMGLA